MLDASPQTAALIAENWQRVCDEVSEATREAGRASNEVMIIGVSKYVDVDLTAQLFDAGCVVLGESRPQNLWGKAETLRASGRSVKWHLIGHLQRNKIRRTLPSIHLLHSLDSLRLAEALNTELSGQASANPSTQASSTQASSTQASNTQASNTQASNTQASSGTSASGKSASTEPSVATSQRLDVLLEVNVTQDATKTGMMADAASAAVERLLDLPHLNLCGLMAMSSLEAGGEDARREFAAVRQLRDSLQSRVGASATLDQLSMGMSGDYREAILEGATMVRIGSSLWRGIIDS
jgi:PLP dependent protein